jgi:hypothetical protein
MLAVAFLVQAPPSPEQVAKLVAKADTSEVAARAAVDALAEAAVQPGFVLASYQRAAGTYEFSTDPRRLAVGTARQGATVATAVTLGSYSKVVLTRNGRPLALPAAFGFLRGFQAAPIFVGERLLVDQQSVQDMGVRYAYRLAVLAPAGEAYRTVRTWSGTWTLDAAENDHRVLTGQRLRLRTIDAPKAFFTSSPERLFTTVTTWDVGGALTTPMRTERRQRELRAVDAWIVAALAARHPSPPQARFRKAWGTGRPMLESWRIASGPRVSGVTLEAEGHYEFRVSSDGTVRFVSGKSASPGAPAKA